MNYNQVVKVLIQNGFVQVSQKGSHVKFSKDSRKVIVPKHGKKDIPLGTLKSIEKQSGVKLK
jgi:predicted RNA binding protein YcfA (HicA-like mRNA interferase family)